jgi:hypothetical protein
VDVAERPGRGTDRKIGRGEVAERELTSFVETRLARRIKAEGEWAAGGDRRGTMLGDRGEGSR